MIEVKDEPYPYPDKQNEVLQKVLSPLNPIEDFHFLTLTPTLFDLIKDFPSQTFLPIAELNPKEISELVFEKQYGGITGHFLILRNALIKNHKQAYQPVGTGMIASKRCLYRELNRGIEWIFTNDALKLKKYL